MIRAGIAGGTSTAAGEIIKLLVNHPDVEIIWVEAPEAEGAFLYQLHKGLRGETYMRFCSRGSLDDINVLFLCQNEPQDALRYITSRGSRDDLRIIDLSGDFRQAALTAESPWVYALPELNRKPLVRGATRAAVPGALATAVLLGLLPLAKHLLLNADIHISAVVPDADAEPGEALALLEHEEAEEISRALKSVQSSFRSPMFYVVTAGGWTRGISVVMYLRCNVSEAELNNIYDTYYEDHGFTFISDTVPNLSEVVGTGKCIINLHKVGDRLVVTTAIDDVLKGSAATAVHNMNLLFGLQERVGLMLIAAK
ncbi:MAG: N-acetyl-gamma-glutamyl-phosphate reductase [Muribaculaceae bacterium]|nr:N-acetyl-gamma-glutamyl-phosphate reductase [Muribaculaceae bacterium]